LILRGTVIKGFGRGSKELGIPTANLDVDALGASLNGVGAGIYCGYAYIDPSPEEIDGKVLEDSVSVQSVSVSKKNEQSSVSSVVCEAIEGSGDKKEVEGKINITTFTNSNRDESNSELKRDDKGQIQKEKGDDERLKLTKFSSRKVYKMVMSIGWNPFFKNEKKTVEPYLIHDFGGKDFYGSRLSLVVTAFLRPELNYTTLEALIIAIHKDIALSSALLDLETKKDDIKTILIE
jgi:riboflavin kinase